MGMLCTLSFLVSGLDIYSLDNFSELALSLQQSNLLLAALTAVKKMLLAAFLPI